jgi:endonuclease/exonuclease/phosphatase family metal-dependent hydrolase
MLPSKHGLRRRSHSNIHRIVMKEIVLTGIVVISIVFCILAVLVTSNVNGEAQQNNMNERTKLGTAMLSKRTHSKTMLDPLAVSLEALTIVSMNLAGCQPSRSAPWDWNQQMSTDAVRTEILKSDPDIIALQECPGGVKWAERVLGDSYRALGATYSHADQVVLLVKTGIQAELVPLPGLPAVMIELQYGDNCRLLMASVHLAPFKQGAYERRSQVEALLKQASSKSYPLLFAGDTNMRASEDEVMQVDLQLLDVWKMAGSNPATKFTWDTIDHRRDGGFFNQYYGEDTRQYTARYDRFYVFTANSSIEVEIAPSFELLANKPMTSKLDFLSDHFGMSSQINLKWKN